MRVQFQPSPVHAPEVCFSLDAPLTITEVLTLAQAPDWFMSHGVVRLSGHVIAREKWSRVRVKPESCGILELCVVPQGKRVLPILLTVATVALTAGVGAGLLGPAGLGFLGSSFGAGGIGASLAATAIGLGGQLLVTALTAPPKIGQQDDNAKELSEAGITVNQPTLFEPLPVVFGKVGFSPPTLMPTRTKFLNGELWVEAIVGCQGPNQISNVLINGKPAAEIPRLEIETREGMPGDTPRTLCTDTIIEQTAQTTLSNFLCETITSTWSALLDQTTPANSVSKEEYFRTDGTWDAVRFRLVAPQGLATVESSYDVGIALRLEIRKVGDVAWRSGPVFHIFDRSCGISPVRCEITLRRERQADGVPISSALGEFPIFEATSITGPGQAFQYQSDPYFRNTSYQLTDDEIPVMTGYTTSGVTMSASSDAGSLSYAAWYAADTSAGTAYWRPADNSLPAWLQVQFPVAKTIRSYDLVLGATATSVTLWMLQGSNDGVNFTNLHAANQSAPAGGNVYSIQVGNPGAYTIYRLVALANGGAANQECRVYNWSLKTYDAVGVKLSSGFPAVTTGFGARSTYVSLGKDGATVWLDPAQWPAGEYEFKLRRSWAFYSGVFDVDLYSYGGNSIDANFFGYTLTSGKYVVYESPHKFRGDLVVENFATIENVPPFDPAGLSFIALRVPNTQINTVYAEFTSYGHVWDGTAWNDALTPTQNPAALYRDLMLGRANPDPLPGELLDEDALITWYNRCQAGSLQCNAISQGESVQDVMQMLGSTGFAAPRMAEQWSVIEDYNTSAEPVRLGISPINSEDLGTDILLPRVPHAVQVEYFDATDSYAVKQAIIYADNYDASNATLFETWKLTGFTDLARATARAQHDLRQVRARARRYNRRVSLDGYLLKRGDLVALNSDVLDTKQAFAVIAAVGRSGGNIVSIDLESVVNFAAGQADVTAIGDMGGVGDITGSDQSMGVAIQLSDGGVLVKTVSTVTAARTAVFVTPFADTGTVVPGLAVMIGVAGREFRRCRVMAIEPQGYDSRRIELADEAPELFA
jgi:hypothetical protein